MELFKQKPLHWTSHAKSKMNFYRLSEQRVRRVLHTPKRIEEGVAENTIAAMQPVSIISKTPARNAKHNVAGGEDGKKKETWNQEIWVMIEETKKERKIISAWRYPGMTKSGDPLPAEILAEIKASGRP